MAKKKETEELVYVPLDIYGAINAVMKEIGPISKDRQNTQQNYKFRGIDDAMNAFQPLFAKYGIVPCITNIQDIVSEPVLSKSGGAGYHYVRRFTIRFSALDGSFIEVMSDGEAIDYGDKSSNKAMSVAYREALFKTFIVPFENDDIENYNHSLEMSTRNDKPKIDDLPF